MKEFSITLKLYHESFGGYDLYDGERVVKVMASNVDVARRKALRELQQTRVGWAIVVKVD